MARRPEPIGRALLVGVASTLWHLPPLLRGAGLGVESVTVSSPYFRLPGSLRVASRCATLTDALVLAAERVSQRHYDLVVTSDDTALRLLRAWDGLPAGQRLLLAPVTSLADLEHLASKVVLAARLETAGLPVPRWREAYDPVEAEAAAQDLGWPVVLKNDLGSGGRGVRIATNLDDLTEAWRQLRLAHSRAEANLPPDVRRPMRVLIQENVPGRDLDLSAFFRRGELVHFTLSRFTETLTVRGASSQRHYLPTSAAQPGIVEELTAIGDALGLNSFANITARETPDGRSRAYIEVDARPNLWTHVGAQAGDDPVARLRKWFATGQADLEPTGIPSGVKSDGVFLRMAHRTSRGALLRNTDSAITTMPWGPPRRARAQQHPGTRPDPAG